MDEEHSYFTHDRFRVTADIVRARRRSIQLSTIEGVEITRPLFVMAVTGCAGLAGIGLVFGDLLYFYEIIFFLALGGGLMALSWNVGELRVFSKLTRTKGWAVYWWIKPLQQMRDGIEAAMLDRARPGPRSTPTPAAASTSAPAQPPRPAPAVSAAEPSIIPERFRALLKDNPSPASRAVPPPVNDDDETVRQPPKRQG